MHESLVDYLIRKTNEYFQDKLTLIRFTTSINCVLNSDVYRTDTEKLERIVEVMTSLGLREGRAQ